MKPFLHAQISCSKWGGTPEQYQHIHDWFDQSKAHFADMRHRALLHSSFGIYLCEQVFGVNITIRLENGNKKLVSVRDIGEQHCIDDLGTVPSVSDYLSGMPFYDWLGGKKKTKQVTRLSGDSVMSVDTLNRLLILD